MTAKRFKVEKNEKWICIFDEGKSIGNIYDVCECLNALHEENQSIKRELDNIYLLIGKGDWSGLIDLLIDDEKCKTKAMKSIK